MDLIVTSPFLGRVFGRGGRHVSTISPGEKQSRLQSLQTALGTIEIIGIAHLACRLNMKYGFLQSRSIPIVYASKHSSCCLQSSGIANS